MPRRGAPRTRKVIPDPVYGSLIVTKLINRSMFDGKKSVVQKQVYRAFEMMAEKTKKNPLEVFMLAIDNIKPTMEVRPRRVGGAAYQVPMPVRGGRQEALAIRWLVAAARSRSNSEVKTYADKLAMEITEAAAGQGGAVKKREEMEKVAEANKAFAHFRW